MVYSEWGGQACLSVGKEQWRASGLSCPFIFPPLQCLQVLWCDKKSDTCVTVTWLNISSKFNPPPPPLPHHNSNIGQWQQQWPPHHEGHFLLIFFKKITYSTVLQWCKPQQHPPPLVTRFGHHSSPISPPTLPYCHFLPVCNFQVSTTSYMYII